MQNRLDGLHLGDPEIHEFADLYHVYSSHWVYHFFLFHDFLNLLFDISQFHSLFGRSNDFFWLKTRLPILHFRPKTHLLMTILFNREIHSLIIVFCLGGSAGS